MDSKRSPLALILVAVAASAAALYFGTGLRPIWLLAWIAPIPVLLLAPRVSRTSAFAAALVACAIGDLTWWRYLHTAIEIPLASLLLVVCIPALVFAADVVAYRAFLRISPWRAAVIFPAVWVLYEFVGERLSPNSTAGNISYSQMNFLPVLQLASVTGIWGISFCLFLFASTMSVVLSGNVSRGEKSRLAIGVGLVLAVVLGFGAWRLHSTPPSQTVVVGLVASDLPENILTTEHADTMRQLRAYAAEAQTLASQGATAIVMPEKIAVVRDSDLSDVDALFTALAAKTGASVIVGVIHPTRTAKWNEARLYFPNGTIRVYEKEHMVPSFESSFTIGTQHVQWQAPAGRCGLVICKDMDFPSLSRQYGNDGTALMLVPAWDFKMDGWEHGRMAILRGVESGFSIARAPKQGILSVSDDRGRVLAERETNSAPFASIVAAVPMRHDGTLYARFGDWFGWFNIALLLVLIATANPRRKAHD
jgi:apolipoprotein N-acyltransferase